MLYFHLKSRSIEMLSMSQHVENKQVSEIMSQLSRLHLLNN